MLPASGDCLTRAMAVGAAPMADSQRHPLLSVTRRLPLVQMRGRSQRRAVLRGLKRAVVMRPGHRMMGVILVPLSCQMWSRQRACVAVPPACLPTASGERGRLSPLPGQSAAAQCCCTPLSWSLAGAGSHALRLPGAAMPYAGNMLHSPAPHALQRCPAQVAALRASGGWPPSGPVQLGQSGPPC